MTCAFPGECDESPPGGEAHATVDLRRLWGGATFSQADQVCDVLLMTDSMAQASLLQLQAVGGGHLKHDERWKRITGH